MRELMHRHRELCERAVDPLEIAAGLEAHGVTDRTAARFRHRDVFSLAEELYARVPRAEAPAAAPRPADPAPLPSGPVRAALHVLPGALAATTVTAVTAVQGPAPSFLRPALAFVGAVFVVLALRLCLRSGPLRTGRGVGRAAALWTCWLAGYALFADRLLGALRADGPEASLARLSAALPSLSGAFSPVTGPASAAAHAPFPSGPLPAAAAIAVALCCAVAPAAWCARWFAVRGRRRLAASRGLGEFAAGMRPLLAGAALLFVAATVALLAVAGVLAGRLGTGSAAALPPLRALTPFAAALTLAVLLFLARLLAVHGFPAAAGRGLAVAVALEAVALATLPAGRLPGAAAVARPVEAAAGLLGPAVVPAVACAAAALGLFVYGLRALTGAAAHSPAPGTAALRSGTTTLRPGVADTPPPGPPAAATP
ncbi:hypothetical protein [Streptomyces ochraceiscleroticus]|uniref:Integral membrane protein n=1 Tax=Streptomyces ochraceiscleroticus TaxID=47761 RepID=A0ABW1MBE1_9ACTN|nr:hypothetical protein [Streptomyces ochraceiscleroticus]